MRDVDDAHAFGPQLADLAEQKLDLSAAQGCRGFIKDQKFRVSGQRFGDLDQLLVGGGQARDLARGGDCQAKAAKLFGGALHHRGAIHHAALHG